MSFLLDAVVTLISLVFLGILGIIAGVAIPGLFLAAAAPWLDWILPPDGQKSGRPGVGGRPPGPGVTPARPPR
jgi:hypothetical protein